MESASCNFSWPTKLRTVWPFGQLSKIIIFNSGREGGRKREGGGGGGKMKMGRSLLERVCEGG